MVEVVGTDGWTEAMQLIGVSLVVGGKVARQEFFEEDQLDAALARFDELRPSTRHRLENACSRIGERHGALMLTAGAAPPDDMFAPNFVSDDRRSGISAGVLEGQAAIASTWEQFGDNISIDRVRGHTLAIRGERLALSHVSFEAEGFVVEFLGLESIDDLGRIDRTVMFDPDALADAFAELNRLHLEGEGKPWAEYLSVPYAMQEALNRGDVDGFAADLPERLRVIDHRGLGWPELDRQGLIELSTTPEAMARGIVGTTEILRVGERSMVAVNFSFVQSAADLREPAWDYITVGYQDRDDDVLEFFPVDALDAAMARSNEVEATPPGRRQRGGR